MPVKKSPASAKRGSASSKRGSTSSKKSPPKKVVAKKVAPKKSPVKKVVAKRASASSKRSSSSKKASPAKKIVVKSTPAGKALDLSKKSEAELRRLAAKHGLKLSPKTNKATIIKMIQQKTVKTSPKKEDDVSSEEPSEDVVSEDVSSSSDESSDELSLTPPKASPPKASPSKASPKASPATKTIQDKYRKASIDKLRKDCQDAKISSVKGKKCADITTKNRKDLEKELIKRELEKLRKQKEEAARKEKLLMEKLQKEDKLGYYSNRWKECPDKDEIYDIESKDCKPKTYEGLSKNGIQQKEFVSSDGKKYNIAGTESQLKEFEAYFNQRTATPARKAPPPSPKKKEWWEQGCYDPAIYEKGKQQYKDNYRCVSEAPNQAGKGYNQKNPSQHLYDYVLKTKEGRSIYSKTLHNLKILQEKIGGVIQKIDKTSGVTSSVDTSHGGTMVTQSERNEPVFSAASVANTANLGKPNTDLPAFSTTEHRNVPVVSAPPPPVVSSPVSRAPPPPAANEDDIIRNVRAEFAKCLQKLTLQ